MTRRRTARHDPIAALLAMTAPGYLPWVASEPTCPSGKRRWPTAHAADRALISAREQRMRRSRGRHLGSIEQRIYLCPRCDGYHLTSQPSRTETVA